MPNRFFEKIAYGRSDCWTWVGAVETGGYGYFPFENEKKAHRVSYVLFSKKPIPAKKMVLHSCDNPPCVNPEHLFLGTQKDNMRDARAKGRLKLPPRKHGEENPMSKLKKQQVLEIKRLSKAGLSGRAICSIFKVSPMTISRILSGATWKKVQ
jgi:hypothetical protein